jgi:pyrroline-5-carboxylate reductase
MFAHNNNVTIIIIIGDIMKIQSIGFIGGGRITRLLLLSLNQKKSLPEKVIVSDPNEEMRAKVKMIDDTLIQCVHNNDYVLNVDVLFLAVHPPVVKEIAAEINGKIKSDTIVVSLIPVIPIEKLSSMLGIQKLIRMIPNAPSLIHKGYNPIIYSDKIGRDEKQRMQALFSNWGESPEVSEDKLEAYAIITAMGPTYFWFQWLKLQELGRQFGLSDVEMNKGMAAMLNGSTDILFKSNLPANDILDLIPVCPIKDDESFIQEIFDKRLTGLYKKLTQK